MSIQNTSQIQAQDAQTATTHTPAHESPESPLCGPTMRCMGYSLPRSLRHDNEEEPIMEAVQLAAFLRDATSSMLDLPTSWGTDDLLTARGYRLCMDLLLDKLEIAAGVYAFPLATDTAPALCERKEW